MGLVGMAITNGFIIHKMVQKKKGEKITANAKFMHRIHNELLGLQPSHFESNMLGEDFATEPIETAPHRIEQVTERYSEQKKLRQFLCKVCSALSSGKNAETTYVCPTCTSKWGGRVALCNKGRRIEEGNTLTCAQIWHDRWKNGTKHPPGAKRIRFRNGKRKKSQQETNADQEILHWRC